MVEVGTSSDKARLWKRRLLVSSAMIASLSRHHGGRLAPSRGVAQQGRGMSGTTKQDHQAERLQAIRLRYTINTHLEDQGFATPAAIAATGLPATEAVRLLTRRQWREGDVAALKAIADRLGLDIPLEGLGLPVREGRGPCPRLR